MVSITYNFNHALMEKHGITADDLLASIRHVTKEAGGIREVSEGHFEKDGEDALRLIYFAMDDLKANRRNLPFLQTVMSDVDGEMADCKDAFLHFKVR